MATSAATSSKSTSKAAKAKAVKATKAKVAKAATPKAATPKPGTATPGTAKAKATKAKATKAKATKPRLAAAKAATPPAIDAVARPPAPAAPPRSGIPSPSAARARLLVDGAVFGAATLSLHALPPLRLMSGTLVACDPLEVHGPPLTRRLRRGSYDVVAAVATYPGKRGAGEQRLAAVILRVTTAPPVAWEPATFVVEPAADDPAYRADSGAGCFMDLHLQAALAAEPSTFPTASYRALEPQLLEQHHVATWGWAVYPEPPTAAGCVAFLGGSGSTRRSYWGLDADGAVACLLTDLESFPDDVWAGLAPAS